MNEKIEKKRAELIAAVRSLGLASSLAIQFSQELDLLLNEYEKCLSCSE
nr:aspartyl-phosphate phosphatase Spo0E family protein [Metabacillus kandeliae]